MHKRVVFFKDYFLDDKMSHLDYFLDDKMSHLDYILDDAKKKCDNN